MASDPRFARDLAQSVGFLSSTIMAMPLETERELLGVIEVLDASGGRPPTPPDLELLGLFAAQAALAIESGRRIADLGRTLLETAGTLTDDDDLAAALRRAADAASGPQAEFTALVALFAELERLEPAARVTATRLVEDFLSFLRARDGA